jgi:KDO2-lipid IV(A) lauroyltransferase
VPDHDRHLLTDALTVGGYRTGATIARLLPGPVAGALAAPIGISANVASPERRRTIERHLRRVDPTLRGVALRRAVQEAFDSYARYWVESFRLPTLSKRTVAAGMRVEGFEHIEAGLARGNGIILALPHLGGWEWAGRWMADIGHQMTVVVEAIEPPELLEWFADLRQKLGMTVVPLGPDAARTVLNALSSNQIVCLLCDRDIQGGGVEVEFFGERTTLPAGPATLSLRTGAALLPTAVYFTKRGREHFGLIRPHLTIAREGKLRDDVGRLTQALAHELEVLIRRAPEQWHMFQPNWPSDPGYGR